MCPDGVTQQNEGKSLGHRGLKGSSLWFFIATGFILTTASRCWVQFYGLCKAGRLYMAKNLLTWPIFKTIGWVKI